MCDDVYRIVESMDGYGQPEALAPDEKITQICAQKQPRYKAVELEVNGAEDKGDAPNGQMAIYTSGRKQALECAAEEQLFAESGEKSHNQDADNQIDDVMIALKDCQAADGIVFASAEPVFETAHRLRQRHVVVQLDYIVHSRGGNHEYDECPDEYADAETGAQAKKIGRHACDEHRSEQSGQDQLEDALNDGCYAHGRGRISAEFHYYQ